MGEGGQGIPGMGLSVFADRAVGLATDVDLKAVQAAVLQLQDGSLNGFQVDVSCQSYGPISEDGQTHTWYTLTALAHSGSPGQTDSVARTLEADLWL